MIEKIKARWAAQGESAKRGIVAGSVFFALLLLTLWAGSCAKVWNTNVVRGTHLDRDGNDTKGWCASCRKTCTEKGL